MFRHNKCGVQQLELQSRIRLALPALRWLHTQTDGNLVTWAAAFALRLLLRTGTASYDVLPLSMLEFAYA